MPIYITESGCSDGANRGSQDHFDAAKVMSSHDCLSEMNKAITAQCLPLVVLGPVFAVTVRAVQALASGSGGCGTPGPAPTCADVRYAHAKKNKRFYSF